MAIKNLRTARDLDGYPVCPYKSEYKNMLVLVASTAKPCTAPSAARFARFVCTVSPFYVDLTSTAVIPVGDTTDGSDTVFIDPEWLTLNGGETVSIICDSNAIIMVEFYS